MIRRAHFTLLEIMIAFFIVSICAIPLLAPNLWMIRAERSFSFQIEAGRVANLVMQKLLEMLYDNSIPWEALNDKVKRPVPFDINKEFNFPSGWPYSISYALAEKINKKGQDNSQSFHLFYLDLFFKPNDQEKELHFRYEMFIERKLKSTAVEPSKLEEK